MLLLSAEPLLKKQESEYQDRVQKLIEKTKRKPKLSVILVGDDPASHVYVSKKGERASKIGVDHETIFLPEKTSEEDLIKKIIELNQDHNTHGILLQSPLPKHLDSKKIFSLISPKKDVDCFHPENLGLFYQGRPRFIPCTPYGILELLKHYQIPLEGKLACVLGRSLIVGKPMVELLVQNHASVLQLHSKSKNASSLSSQADLVVCAVGKPEFLGKEYFKKDAVVIDVGIHRNSQKKLVGDVKFMDVKDYVSAITPVPGGVGPLTISGLLANTLQAFQEQCL